MIPARLRALVGARVGTVGREALRIYAAQIASLGLGLVTGIVVARALGPAGKGVVDLFTLLSAFILEIGSLGFYSGLLYHLANRGRPLAVVHGSGVAFALGAGALTLGVGALGLPAWRAAFPGLPDWIILAAFALAPAAYYRLIWQTLLTGLNRAYQSYLLACWSAVAILALTLALLAGGTLTAGRYVALTTAVTALSGLAAFAWLRRGAEPVRVEWGLMRSSLRFGVPLYLGLVANAINFKVDQVLLNLLLGSGAVGVYAVSVRWAETLFLLDTALIAASLHRISSASRADSYAFTREIARKQFLVSGGAGLALALVSYPLLVGLYGREYVGAVVPLVILVPGIVAWSLSRVLSQYIVYQCGVRWLPTGSAVAGMIANVPLNLLLIPRLGLSGAALASLISYGLVLALTWTIFRRYAPAPTSVGVAAAPSSAS